MYMPWIENAKEVEQVFGGFVNWEEGFYICPECGEPIYQGEWERQELIDFLCPVCEWEGD